MRSGAGNVCNSAILLPRLKRLGSVRKVGRIAMKSRCHRSSQRRRVLAVERLEMRECMAIDSLLSSGSSVSIGPLSESSFAPAALESGPEGEGPELAPPPSLYDPLNDPLSSTLTDGEVELLLARAAAASASEDAIFAVVDRNGRILGVRTEQDVVDNFTGDTPGLV